MKNNSNKIMVQNAQQKTEQIGFACNKTIRFQRKTTKENAEHTNKNAIYLFRRNFVVIMFDTYNKVGPIHGHVHSVIVRPPLQVLLMVRIVDRVIKLFVDLR